jgi:hypothetical protein
MTETFVQRYKIKRRVHPLGYYEGFEMEKAMFSQDHHGIGLVQDGPSFWIRIYGTLCLKIEPHTGCIYWHPGGVGEEDRLVGKIETVTHIKNWLSE